MAITKFKITKSTSRATLLINENSVSINQEYSIALQNKITIDISDVGVPYDEFWYQLGNDNGNWSQAYKCTINSNVEEGEFEITSDIIPVKLNENTNVGSYIELENQVDRIKIISHNPKYGNLMINGGETQIGKTYMKYELTNIIFQSSDNSETPNVESVVIYQKGNKTGFSGDCTWSFRATGNLSGTSETSTSASADITSIVWF